MLEFKKQDSKQNLYKFSSKSEFTIINLKINSKINYLDGTTDKFNKKNIYARNYSNKKKDKYI